MDTVPYLSAVPPTPIPPLAEPFQLRLPKTLCGILCPCCKTSSKPLWTTLHTPTPGLPFSGLLGLICNVLLTENGLPNVLLLVRAHTTSHAAFADCSISTIPSLSLAHAPEANLLENSFSVGLNPMLPRPHSANVTWLLTSASEVEPGSSLLCSFIASAR